MKIAQVAPLTEAVPPKFYGGTERVVAYLTDALVELGHEVTLFASGDSVTKANLASVWPRALRLDPDVTDHLAPVFMELEVVARRAHEFDVIHAHLDYFGFPLLQRLGVPSVTTLHGRLDLPELPKLYELYGEMPVVSISDSQRQPLPQANYVATILHGLPQDLLRRGDRQRVAIWHFSAAFRRRRRRMRPFASRPSRSCPSRWRRRSTRSTRSTTGAS